MEIILYILIFTWCSLLTLAMALGLYELKSGKEAYSDRLFKILLLNF